MKFGEILFTIVGIVVLIIGIIRASRYKKFPKVEAEVVDFTTRSGNKGTLYAPVYTYTFNGELIEDACSSSYNNRRPEIGSIEEIAVNPENPEIFRTKGDYLLLIFVGGGFTFMSIIH